MLQEGWGSTEMGPSATVMPKDRTGAGKSCVGRLVPLTRLRVVTEDGVEAGSDEVGEHTLGAGHDSVRQSVSRRQLKLGLLHYTRKDLEAARDAGAPLQIQVLGLASIAADVTPELARAAIASVEVLGAFQASAAVKAALADRTS